MTTATMEPKAKVDPFAATAKPKPNTHIAPKDDAELGDVSGGIAEFIEAKAEHKVAKARLDAAKGTVMPFVKRVLCGLMAKGPKPKSQRLTGDGESAVTAYYQDKSMNVSDESHTMLCDMFGEDVVDSDLVDSDWTFTVSRERMADPDFKARLTKALQAEFDGDEIPTIFEKEWHRKSRRACWTRRRSCVAVMWTRSRRCCR
jgi:hypothetical protein